MMIEVSHFHTKSKKSKLPTLRESPPSNKMRFLFRAKRGEKFLKFTNEEDINKEEKIILRENTISLRAKRGENFEIFDYNINYKNDYDKCNYNYNN